MTTTSFEDRFGPGIWVSVVIATYDRQDMLRRLFAQLDDQTIDARRYEIIAVDDGSKEDTRARLADVRTACAHVIERQENAGPAVARQRGVDRARGKIVVFLDDDMQVRPTFLERHLEQHVQPDTVVLGRLRPDANLAEMPLFERFYARVLARQGDAFASGADPVRGHNIYTGNVSLPRDLFVRVGGFDPAFRALEDEELGIRLAKAGARFGFANDAESLHGSDWTSMKKWMDRCFRDGVYQTKVARKHPDAPESSPWRHLPDLNPISRPFMALALASPLSGKILASTAIRTAAALDKLGLEPVAIAGATFVYGLQYYRGVRQETGSLGEVRREYRAFKQGLAEMAREGAGGSGASAEGSLAAMLAAIREDHRMMEFYAGKYDAREDVRREGAEGAAPGPADVRATPYAGLARTTGDAVKKIGFQILVAYRVMRWFRARGNVLGAQFVSRLIRHAFGSDIHWDAELAPGVMIVHGFGLAISYAARVSEGCILFQNVTLGYGPGEERGHGGGGGAPLLERGVHVGIGATLYGPIVVGEGSKIMAGCVLARSVPARSIVLAAAPQVTARAPAHRPEDARRG
jgi:serine acetyltransferase/GT2 family glycosyltransferase